MTTILLSILLLAVAVLLAAVKVLTVKGGKFPSGHAHDIERRRQEAKERLKAKRRQ